MVNAVMHLCTYISFLRSFAMCTFSVFDRKPTAQSAQVHFIYTRLHAPARSRRELTKTSARTAQVHNRTARGSSLASTPAGNSHLVLFLGCGQAA